MYPVSGRPKKKGTPYSRLMFLGPGSEEDVGKWGLELNRTPRGLKWVEAQDGTLMLNCRDNRERARRWEKVTRNWERHGRLHPPTIALGLRDAGVYGKFNPNWRSLYFSNSETQRGDDYNTTIRFGSMRGYPGQRRWHTLYRMLG